MTAYNEERPLTRLLPNLPDTVNGHELRTILVDDGSTDHSADVAESHGCSVIRLAKNRGKGAALRTGLQAIRHKVYDGIVLMDSDGQHDPNCLEALTAPISDGSADMVVGSRYLTNGGRGATPWNRYLVRTATVKSLQRFAGIAVTDPYCGYRAFSPKAVGCISLYGDRYESELEMAFCVAKANKCLVEVPIPRIYGPQTSKMAARHGAFLGRVAVVSGYARTIIREVRKLETQRAPDFATMAQ